MSARPNSSSLETNFAPAPFSNLWSHVLAVHLQFLRNFLRKLAIPDLTTTVLTLTITGIAADSSLAKGNNPRLLRRVSSVLAIFFGAAFGAVVIHYSISVALALALATALSVVSSSMLFRSARVPSQA